MLYLILKWLHILSAIVVVGAHAMYGFWIVRASRHPEALPFTLRNVKWIDDRIAMPAFGVLPLTGLGMAFLVRSLFRAPWLNAGMLLFVLLMVVHFAVYRPALRSMIRLLDSDGIESPHYQAAAHREARVGIAMTVLMVVIVYIMTVKPWLWS